MCDRPTTASTTNVDAADRCIWLLHHSGSVCPWRWRLHWLRSVNEDTRTMNGVTVLRLATSVTSNPSCCTATPQMLVVALVHSWLDYGNGVLIGLWAYLMRQSVLNAAARLIYRLRTCDHITDALVILCWSRVLQRTQYKLAVLTNSVAWFAHPSGRSSESTIFRVDDLPGRRTFRSASTNRLVAPPVKLSTVGSWAFVVAAPHYTEWIAQWRHMCWFTINFSATVKTFFISTILSGRYYLTLVLVNLFSQWSLQWLFHLRHFKNILIN